MSRQPPPPPPPAPIPPTAPRKRRRSFRLRPPGTDQPGKPRRRRKLSERPLPWTIAMLLLVLVVVLLAVLLDKHIQDSGGASGGGAFLLITLLGILAVVLIFATFFYTFRKRRRTFQGFKSEPNPQLPVKGRPLGSMMKWFKSHIYLGIVALIVALVHAFTRPWTSTVTTGKITLLVFILLVVSGIAWRLVYRATPPRVAASVGNLATVDTESRINDLQVEIDKLAAGRSAQFQALVSARLRGGPLDIIQQQAATLPEAERPVWAQFVRLATNRDGYLKREQRQRRFERFLQRWKVAHIPLAAILFALIVVHVMDVFGVGRAAFDGRANEFPSSQACATCHTQIAKDWHRSVMSHAVTSPLMVAQTALAVKNNKAELAAHRPGIHALGTICTACHGPIGTALTKSDVLPFGTNIGDTLNPGATGAHDLILAEGESCIVCHALDAAPGVGRGAFINFPVNKSGLTSLGTVHGPVLPGGPPVPVPDHRIVTGGYMGGSLNELSNEIQSSNLCGACHVVQVDLNGGGVNRLLPPGHQPDLVLQTTFLEWQQQYLPAAGSGAEGCVTCHAGTGGLPGASPGAIANGGPFLTHLPTRIVHDHSFVGVDYDLTPGHPGQSDAQFAQDLAERQALLQSAARLDVTAQTKNGIVVATVTVHNVGAGHTLPTGFAFVRQMWIQISAHVDGSTKPVCLLPAPLPGGKAQKGTCGSGQIKRTQDLPYCDPIQVLKAHPGLKGKLGNEDIVLAPGATKPLGSCDPWLASWQKILTDHPNKDAKVALNPAFIGFRHEVGFQTVTNDIVAARFRLVADPLDSKTDPLLAGTGQQIMQPMDPPGTKPNPKGVNRIGDTEVFHYLFDARAFKGQTVDVEAHLMFRHVPPYFLRELDGFYPDGLTPQDLINNLRIVDMANASAKAST